MRPPRPLTHDLFTKFVNSTHYTLESVIIYQIIDGVFFSNLNFKNTEKTEKNLYLDARTSDAVAMAVRFDAPIYTTEQVLNEAGILLEIGNNNELPEPERFQKVKLLTSENSAQKNYKFY